MLRNLRSPKRPSRTTLSRKTLSRKTETLSRETSKSTRRKRNRLALERLEPRLVLDAGPLVISEFMALNSGDFVDEDGDSSDWIEIHNPTSAAVDLDGWCLTDDTNDLDQWRFPAGTIDPGEYRVVFASGKDRAAPGAELHTNFGLDGSGEYLALVQPDGITIASDFGPEYPAQETNISYGLFQEIVPLVPADTDLHYRVPTAADAAADWTDRTFDDSDWDLGGSSPTIVVTEAGTGTPDYIEIQNVSDHTVDTSGWVLALNRPTDPAGGIKYYNGVHTPWNLPDSMAPGEIIYLDDNSAGSNYFGENIVWSTGVKGWAMIVDNEGEVADFAPWYYSETDLADMDVVINGKHIGVSSAWSGSAVATHGSAAPTLQRVGNLDHDDLTDFVFVAADMTNAGYTNPNLVLPLAGGQMPGVGFSASPGAFGGALATDLTAEMLGQNASAWTRIRFQVDDPSELGSLSLKMRYNDGFVAYLNGHPVASSNAPGTPQWNSTATASQTVEQSNVLEQFDASAGLEYLVDGMNVLAIQGLNVSASNDDFLLIAEMDGVGVELFHRYFSTPTPGQPNEAEFLGFVKDTKFSEDRGFHDVAFDLAITSNTPGAAIRYTTDGTEPTETNGQLYTAPITIDTTTVLRAIAFKAGYRSTNIDTQTYVFLDDVIDQPINPPGFPTTWYQTGADYEMDPQITGGISNQAMRDALSSLPVMSLVTEPDGMFGQTNGIYMNPNNQGVAWERPGSMELFYPDDQTEGFQVNMGVRMYGGVGRQPQYKKHSFRLLFKDEYGPTKLRYPLFGDDAVDSFDTIILRSNFNDAWVWGGAQTQFVRDEFAARLIQAMGDPARHGIFVHLYINGLYWGLYNPVERPDTSFSASYYGGEKENWDGINSGSPTGDSSSASWNMLMNLSTGLADNANYQKIQGKNLDGTNNPTYQAYLDMDQYINYLLMNAWAGNNDAGSHNWYAGCERGLDSTGFKAYTWDAEWIVDMRSGLSENAVNDTTTSNWLKKPYTYLRLNDEFQLRFADHVHDSMFNGGTLTPQATIPLYRELADTVEASIVAESARWGDAVSTTTYTENHWIAERNYILSTYLPQRTGIVLGQLRSAGLYPNIAAPAFSVGGTYQHGGDIRTTDAFSISAPQGTIYYTLDGTDPRELYGNVSPTALTFSPGSPITLDQSAVVQSRAYVNGEWSALNKAAYYLNQAASAENLVITEINYNPSDPTEAELAVDPAFVNDDFEFIELKNIGTETVNLANVAFTNGVAFQFTDNNEFLGAGEFVVLAKNASAFEARYGAEPDAVYEGGLKNGGEQIMLLSRLGDPISSFAYADSGAWPGRPDGGGATLELIDPLALPQDPALRVVHLEEGANWRGSSEYGGSPWADGHGPIADVVVNEVLTLTDLPSGDAIELYNRTPFEIDLGGWYLSDTNDDYMKYRIPDGTRIAGGGYLVFDEDDFNPHGGVDPLTYPNEFALNGPHGDDVWLMRADDQGNLTDFVDHVEFADAALGESFGRWPNGTGDLYPMERNTLGTGNSGPRVGPVIFTEIHYNQNNIENEPGVENDAYLEFVEIYNPTNQPVDLSGWRLRKGIDFDFADQTQLAAKATLVVVSFDPLDTATLTDFQTEYAIDGSVDVLGPYSGKLDNAGEKVQLQRPDVPLDEDGDGLPDYTPYLIEDEVTYSNVAPWPAEADGHELSLSRLASNLWGNDPASWVAGIPSPGSAEVAFVAEVVGRHLFYNNSGHDGNDPIADARDDSAVASDKVPLFAEQASSGANYSNYDKGINGILVDILGLADPQNLSADDDFLFRVGNSSDPATWTPAPNALPIAVRVGAGAGGADRVTIRFEDHAIEKQWLEVTVLPTPSTGLTEADVFYFGNAVADAGDRSSNTIVNATDEIAARNFQHGPSNPAAIDDPYDYNRDGLVNATDQIIARGNQTNPLTMLRLIDLTPVLIPVGFVAYNDHIGGVATDPNATTYDAQFGPTASGPLKDIVTGLDTSVRLTTSHSGAVFDNSSTTPAAGTDAADLFGPYVDFSGGPGTSIEIEGEFSDSYTHRFFGLDTGDVYTYDFAGTSVRGSDNYADRWTLVTLVGTESATEAHSSGSGIVVVSPTEVAIIAGQNQLADQGVVAAWTGIDPGIDGEFSVVSTHYTGTIPGGTASGNKSYALTAIRLEAVPNVAKTATSKQAGDVVFEQTLLEQAEADWLYEFERLNTKNRSSQQKDLEQQAIDLLLADAWI